MLANKQNLDIVTERSFSDKRKTGKISKNDVPIGSRSANDQSKVKLRVPLAVESSNQPKFRKETPLAKIKTKDTCCQTEDATAKPSEEEALDWMYSDEPSSIDYWKELANSREQELKKVVEECESLRHQVEMVSNLNHYLMSQLDEREAELAALTTTN